MSFRNDGGSYDIVSILGAVMIIIGLFSVIDMVYIWYPFLDIVAMIVYGDMVQIILVLVGGILVLALKTNDSCSRIAVAGAFIGVSFFVQNIFFTEFYGYVSFIIGIVSFMVGVMAAVSSVSLLCGYSHYATRLFQCVLVMTVVELYPIWACYNSYIPWTQIFSIYYGIPIRMVMYMMFMICLHHESVMIPSIAERFDHNIRISKDILYSESDAYITPDDATSLKGFIDDRSIGRMDVSLRCGSERRILSVSSEADAVPKITVASEDGGELICRFRTDVRMLAYDGGDILRIYGRDGVFIQITVHPMPPKKDLKHPIASKHQEVDAES